MKAGVISEKGMRQEMEDYHFLDMDFGGKGWVFAGIYDGHGGKQAAHHASQKLHEVFLRAVLSGLAPQQAFARAYETTSEEIKEQDSGTTAVTIFIREGRVYAANAGDARAIVVGREGLRQLTVDHRLDDTTERQRIVRMGGLVSDPYVRRGLRGLMPTRTIGDSFFKPVGVIATPSVREYEILKDDLMVVAACDGLFDVMSNSDVADFVRKSPQPERLLEALKREVLVKRGGSDNLTIIAVSLDHVPDTKERRRHITRISVARHLVAWLSRKRSG
ncbi:MAG: PP2C family protein-serine/threonine phosphatase [Dehalococcoidia bacterium]|nr:PP2C family protein-serine/threonine phosphatase [Dehalococcoidia bacterium]